MRVLIEDGFASEYGGGIGRYTQNLFRELNGYLNLRVERSGAASGLSRLKPHLLRRAMYVLWLETGFQSRLARSAPDIIHFTNYLLPRARTTQAKYVVTIHDLSAYRYPETLPRMYAWYLRAAISRAVKMADLILTPSESVRAEVIDLFGLAGERIRTAFNGVTLFPRLSGEELVTFTAHLRQKYGVREPFLLFVGTLEKRKNVATLIRAFARVTTTNDLQLVLVGSPGFGFFEIEGALRVEGCRGPCVLLGSLPDDELAVLYQQAKLFVYPSLYEGFGIPLVEAMGFGVPVVASRIPSTEEVAGGAAAYYDHPLDDHALSDRIIEVLERPELQKELIAEGKIRAANFAWSRVGKMYCDAYLAALSTR